MITLSKKTLLTALTALTRVAPTRTSNPLLSAVRLEVTPQGLTLSATSIEADLRVQVPADVSPLLVLRGPVGVPAHLWHATISRAPGELIELELDGASLLVRSGGSRVRVQLLANPEALPDLTFPEDLPLSLPGADLARAITAVSYCVSREAFQAVFRGLQLEVRAQGTRAVASDGFRLGWLDFAPLAGVTEDLNLIIPRPMLDLLTRTVQDVETVRLQATNGVLHLDAGGVRLNVRLMDGDFPDYERVIPKGIELVATLPAASLRETIQRVSLFSDKNANNRVELRIANGRLRVVAEGDAGTSEEELEVQCSGTADALELGFNSRYLHEGLAPVRGDVQLQFSGAGTPMLITDLAGSGPRGVLVPLRV